MTKKWARELLGREARVPLDVLLAPGVRAPIFFLAVIFRATQDGLNERDNTFSLGTSLPLSLSFSPYLLIHPSLPRSLLTSLTSP